MEYLLCDRYCTKCLINISFNFHSIINPYFIEEETDIPSKWKSQGLYLGSADCKV